MSRPTVDRFEPDYSGVGSYAQRDHSIYGNSKYLYPSNGNYNPGNRKYNRYGTRNYPSKSDNYYDNKYDVDYHDNEPTNPLGRVISNLLQTSQRENQRRIPDRDWSQWKYGDDDVIGNYGYGHRGRRGATMTMNGVLSKTAKINRKFTRSLHLDGSHIQPHHNYIEQMSLDEIKVKLKNTMEKVERIRNRERTRKKQNSRSGDSIGGDKAVEFLPQPNPKFQSRTEGSEDNVNINADKSPSTLPNKVTNASLPVIDKYTTFLNSSPTKNSGVEKSSPISKMETNPTSNNESKATSKSSSPHANVSSTSTGNTPEYRADNPDLQRRVSHIKSKEEIEDSTEEMKKKRKRKKRHVGPHDEGGLQRLISTGTVESLLYCVFRQNLCGNGTGTGSRTDTMPKYRYRSRSHISCSVKVQHKIQ